MASDSYRNGKVRGLWGKSKTTLVLVQGSKIELVKVRSADIINGKWTFTTLDGVKRTLPQEKKKIQYIKKPDIATNCYIAYDRTYYDKVAGDYTTLELSKTEYRLIFKKWRFLKKEHHMSSPICEVWKENGRYHAITMSGAHYVFPIR